MTGRTFSIRELTKALGITARTLRHYEDEGLIAPERRGATRIYSGRDRARLTLILRGRRVGFALAEIKDILDLYDSGDGGITQLQHARKKFAERIAALERQKKDIEDSAAELRLGLEMIESKLSERHAHERSATNRVQITGYGLMPAED
ncbi:MAG TPA: MerR family DNA-binding transcriptional regulator [Rhizomicrobium sp.]|jgi:DNA-binding transcriptional MerR regulator|nr:MerR family DNA-binding transcriptional regulator [Rhizomicrobium sp.]